jgi:glycerophosphoryl diester phosphodiesterase
MLLVASRPTSLASPSATKQVVAHRGYHDGKAPYENTTAAFERAISVGVDLMEMDVLRTLDGVLVLHHDKRIDGHVISQTRYADLPKLPNGERVSTLQSVVDLAATKGGSTRLLVETKERGFEKAVVDMLRSRLRPAQYELMSFDLDSVRALRQLAPDSKVGVLFGLLPDWQSGTWPISGAAMVSKARALGVDFVSIDRHFASNGRIQALADAGLEISVWTVDKTADMRKYLADARITSIITDEPETAMKLRDAQKVVPISRFVTGTQAAEWWQGAVAA